MGAPGMKGIDFTPCPVCHVVKIQGGKRIPCGCPPIMASAQKQFTDRFFPRQGDRRLKEITKSQFQKLGGLCHHKKSDRAETTAQFKAESGPCIRDFGNCWRSVRHPDQEES